MYGGVRGRKTKVGEKLLRFSPTRFPSIVSLLDEASKNNVLNAIFISILKFSHKSSGKLQKRLSKHDIPFYLTYSFSKDYRVNDYK